MNVSRTRILVVDDSALYRQSIHNVLREVHDATVIGSAKNGVQALEKIAELDPDLLTLDVQMPDMDGIQVLREIKRRRLRTKAIMVSGFTSEGAQLTTDALMEGAFDFVLKPSSGDALGNRQQLRDALAEKIAAFRVSLGQRSSEPVAPRDASIRQHEDSVAVTPATKAACRAVIIGASTGGPVALSTVLPKLPADLPVPVLVVQHMPAQYTRSLAARLDGNCKLDVVEAATGLEATAGKIIIAAGGQQTKLSCVENRLLCEVNDDPPENGTRPSVDYLVRSASEVLEGNVLVVIMTGMGRDGLEGCRQLKAEGGRVFVQHQDDCIVYGMPKAIIADDLADRVLSLSRMGPAIVRHVERSRRS